MQSPSSPQKRVKLTPGHREFQETGEESRQIDNVRCAHDLLNNPPPPPTHPLSALLLFVISLQGLFSSDNIGKAAQYSFVANRTGWRPAQSSWPQPRRSPMTSQIQANARPE